jgi:hypothetical protein
VRVKKNIAHALVKKRGDNIFSPLCIIWDAIVVDVNKLEAAELADAELENANARQSKDAPNVADVRPELADAAVNLAN